MNYKVAVFLRLSLATQYVPKCAITYTLRYEYVPKNAISGTYSSKLGYILFQIYKRTVPKIVMSIIHT